MQSKLSLATLSRNIPLILEKAKCVLVFSMRKPSQEIVIASRRRSNPGRHFVHGSFWIASLAARKDGYFELINSRL